MDQLSHKNVPVFILAGGLGTRLAEETGSRPKPMVEIGGRPILWHIMMYYSQFGFTDFVICAGYMAETIKEFFSKLHWYGSSVEFQYQNPDHVRLLKQKSPCADCRVRVIDTGLATMTGGRIAKALDEIELPANQDFALTYGDGLCDMNLADEYAAHVRSGKIGTVTGGHPLARFGVLETNSEGEVTSFQEKPHTTVGLINGGFFFFKGSFREYLSNHEDCILERKPLEKLANDRQLNMFKHDGFWQCMDTVRDKQILQSHWDSPQCPWRIWKED